MIPQVALYCAKLSTKQSQSCSPLLRFSTKRSFFPVVPLKEKILNPVFSRPMTINGASPAMAEPTDDPDDVLFKSEYGVRTIELNRPAKLNSLNGSMARKIALRLQEWEKSQLANIVIIKGAGERAFCAGGDVTSLAIQNKQGPDGQAASAQFFALEYQINHLIATYSKPYVAFMDGITMGGGVGLSVHAPFRVATERTRFAMPETTIGFFPDVGGSFFLSRLDGEIGTYLALTSEHLKGVHTMYAGIATHYIHSSSLPDLEQRLAELVFDDSATMDEKNAIVDATIEEFVTGLPDEQFTLSGDLRQAIDRCFRFNTVGEILTALGNENTQWAQKTIATIHAHSPTSVRVALKQLRLGSRWNISETFRREHYIAARFMEHPDFVEGVSAKLINKTGEAPHWSPATLAETPESITEQFFKIEEGRRKRLPLLKDGFNFTRYPHEHIGLPSEHIVKSVVERNRFTPAQLAQQMADEYRGKKGVKAKVYDMAQRMTTLDEMGCVRWRTA